MSFSVAAEHFVDKFVNFARRYLRDFILNLGHVEAEIEPSAYGACSALTGSRVAASRAMRRLFLFLRLVNPDFQAGQRSGTVLIESFTLGVKK
jgi:hypothetical protein